ncbi:hypothetical protein BGW42_002672 [Actinomortierella wolfii]|nr:hypothetical protein BGW42_002672 [Actinomortierella wolfii]
MSKLVPLQITIIALSVVSIILSLLYHLSVEAIRIFYQEVPPSDEPTRLPPPDPKPPLFTPFGIISLVALLFTLVIHCAQPDYLAPREEEGAEELANGNDAQGSRPASHPLSSSTTPSTYSLIVPGDGWMSWLDFFNTVKTVEEKWIGPYQCRNMELPCQLLLAQAILAFLLVLLLLAEIIILYIGQRSLAKASSTCQPNNLHMQDRVRPQHQQRVHHPRGRPQSTTAVKPLPPIPEASSIPTPS